MSFVAILVILKSRKLTHVIIFVIAYVILFEILLAAEATNFQHNPRFGNVTC